MLGLEIGADDYISKPFDERELLARVGNMMRLKRMHDEVAEARQRLERLAVRDEMTGLYNYRYLHTRLGEEFNGTVSAFRIDHDYFIGKGERCNCRLDVIFFVERDYRRADFHLLTSIAL